MVWTKKASSPAFVNMGEAFSALISGDNTWGWLLGWVPILGNPTVDVAALCAAGPPTVQPITIADFIPTHPRNWREQIQANVQLADRLRALAYDRIFGAYCEINTPAGTMTADLDVTNVCSDPPTRLWRSGIRPVPAGSTHYQFEYTGVTTTQGARWSTRSRFYNDAAGSSSTDPCGTQTNLPATPSYTCGPAALPAGYPFYEAFLITDDAGQACGNVRVSFDGGGSTTHNPTAQPQPVGLPNRGPTTPPTLPTIAAELDNIEFKLDHMTSVVDYLASIAALAPAFSDPPVAAVPETPVDLTGANGVIVALSGIPVGADEQFGSPPKFHRIGRLTLGTAAGWLPSFDLEHNPLVIMPLPMGVTRAVVSVKAPITATVTILRPGK